MIDVLLTWLINGDREFLQGGATGATKPGMKVFPYLATPNAELQSVTESVALAGAPDAVWSVIGRFDIDWHPLIAGVSMTGTGLGQLRTIRTRDGGKVIERLEEVDNTKRFYRYAMVTGIPASHYTGTIEVKPNGSGGAVAKWSVQYQADDQPDIIVRSRISALLKTGLESLKSRFGVQA